MTEEDEVNRLLTTVKSRALREESHGLDLYPQPRLEEARLLETPPEVREGGEADD